MTPKKLTDCPENLREAIDWLIQVRYGGDGKGLENLAKVLKELIEGAMRDTYNSILVKYAKSLESSWKTKECCKDKFSAIDKLQKLLKQPNFLENGHLNDHLKQLRFDKESCENNHYVDSSKDTALKDVDSRLLELNKLRENLDGLIKDPETCLTQLNSGLETFLGFNSEAKGYNGTGIVYSDLDRLCDGVMGFLHGVFESVKNEDAIKTYDFRYRFNDIAESIKGIMYSGSGGFPKVINAVCEALQAWDLEVTGKSALVRESFLKLEYDFCMGINTSLSDLKDCDVSNVVDKLEACFKNATKLREAFRSAKAEYSKVDVTLRNQLQLAVSNVEVVVEKFVSAATNDELKAVVLTATNELETLKSTIIIEVEKHIVKLFDELQREFEIKIKTPIENVKNGLVVVNEDMQAWMVKSEEVITEVKAKAEEVYHALNPAGSSNTQPIGNNIASVEGAIQEVEKLKRGLKGVDSNLQKWNNKATEIVSKGIGKCEKVLEGVKGKGGLDPVIKEKATELKTKATDLLDAYNSSYTKVTALTQKVNAAIEELETEIKKDLHTMKTQIKGGLQKVIGALKAGIDAAKGDGAAANIFIQEFNQGLDDRESVRHIYSWSDTARRDGSLHVAFQQLHNNTSFFEIFKKILTQLDVDQNNKGTFYSVLNQDIGDKVDGKLKQEGDASESKVKLDVLEKYNLKKSAMDSQYKKLIENVIPHALNEFTRSPGLNGVENVSQKSSEVANLEEAIHSQLRYITDLVDQKTGLLFDEKDKGVKVLLDELNDMMGENTKMHYGVTSGIKTIQKSLAYIYSQLIIHNGSINRGISEIKVQLGVIQKKLKTQGSDDVITRLQDLIDTGIRNSGDWKLDEKIKGLQNIKDRISNIIGTVGDSNSEGDTLKGIITAAGNFYQKIYDDTQSAIKKICEKVKMQITEKTKKIKTEARTVYYCKINPMFVDMKSRVTARNNDINHYIEKDLRTGVKGLIKALRGNVDGKIPRFPGVRNFGNLLEELKLNPSLKDSEKFTTLSQIFKNYLDRILDYIIREVKKMFPNIPAYRSKAMIVHPYPTEMDHVKRSLEGLLNHLIDDANRNYNFDHTLNDHLRDLENSLSNLSPENFGVTPYVNLDALKHGISALCDELGKAYISKYDGATITWKRFFKKSDSDDMLTDDAKKCAKVCLTTVSILYKNLSKLREKCISGIHWSDLKIEATSELGEFLKQGGFQVSHRGKQNGELQNKVTMTGKNIHSLLLTKPNSVFSQTLKVPMVNLRSWLHDYYKTCHLAVLPSPTTPCNVFQMLGWFCGLRYHPVRETLCNFLKELFPKPEGQKEIHYSAILPEHLKLPATSEITYNNLIATLGYVCDHAEKTLIAILGHGCADGRYACDFNTNPDALQYPSDPSKCLDILVDILHRVCDQLSFLYEQCRHGQAFGAWNRCWYGKQVGGSAWRCNDLQCPNQTGDEEHNQRCDRKCNQLANCGVKSPLQSFLEDGLQGFLPHPITSVGCGVKCTLANHRGLPCKTPMGFSDISVTASHRQTGVHLEAVLYDLCGKPDSPLRQLCSYIMCLLSPTPQTLGDMFAFYYNFLNKWNLNDGHKRYAFVKAVLSANFKNPKTQLEIAPLFGCTDHVSGTDKHPNGDLYSLVGCEHKEGDAALPCGPYLRPLSRDILNVFSEKHAGKYLSWIVYLTETFYDLLKKLYDDCCEKCDKKGTRCHDNSCAEKCTVKYTNKEGEPITPPKTANHDKDCSSIVQCPHTLRTLCRYGFYFGSSWRMSGERAVNTKRTCIDLCRALERVLSKKESDGAALATLIYKSIPNFLWNIRSKFFWTTVALWLLSLLYLLHIMVIRLDLLHIKSHLHSPSSHRIAAQSLLAAARVGKLSKISYLQA